MANRVPSTFLASGFTPNPYYSKISSLLSDENADFINRVLSSAEDAGDLGLFGNDIPSDLVDKLVEEFDDDLERIINTFEATPLEEPQMPPAPHATVLYGRVSQHQPALDIGSGDGRKAEKSKIRNLVLSDLQKPEGHYSRKWVVADAEKREDLENASEGGQRVILSNMLLSQLETIEHVSDFDGLHVVPDVDVLKEMGARELEGDRILSRFRGQEFIDKRHDYGAVYKLVPGYMGVVTFARRLRYIEIQNKCFKATPPELPKVYDAKFNVDPESTPKYDGVQLFFDVRPDNSGVVMNRSGLARKFEHNFDIPLQFIAEVLPGGVFVLLRILYYHGFVPWHSLSVLREFCERVQIDIGGTNLLYPGHEWLKKAPTDGVIMRHGEMDFRIKHELTVDLDAHTWENYKEHFKKTLTPFEIDEEPNGGIHEYVVVSNNGVYEFKRRTGRMDKDKATAFDVFKFQAKMYF